MHSRPAGADLEHDARAVPRHGREGEGVHLRRRHLPGRALAAFRSCRSSCRPSRSTARCAGSIPRRSCSSSISTASRRRLEPGDPGAAARRQGHDPADRRHPPARRHAAGRGRWLAADLLSDPKELAEHLMLLDLGRNDVGRVAKIGTVKVTEHNEIEYYSHVMHIVSNVEGEIEPQHDAIDALIGGFPAGTVSRRAEGPGHGDHRRAGAGAPRRLCRRRRLFRRQRRDGHLHRAAHRRGQGRRHVCPGRRRRGRRQRSRSRVSGNAATRPAP